MMMLQRTFTALTLLSYTASVAAVTLSEFAPQASNLTPTCSSVYHNTPISGCMASDFTAGTCSTSCVQGLVSISNLVYQSCGSSVQNDQFLIAAFLAGQGIHSLCPNVVVVTNPVNGQPTATSMVTLSSPQSTAGGLVMDTSSSPLPSSTLTSDITSTVHTTIQKTIQMTTEATRTLTTSSPSGSSTTSIISSTTQTTIVVPQQSSSLTFSPSSPSAQPSAATVNNMDCVAQGDTTFDYCSVASLPISPGSAAWLALLICLGGILVIP